MTTAGFRASAQVTSGSDATTSFTAYDVLVNDGRLRLSTHASTGTVLDVTLDRVRTRPLGRAGSTVVEVDGSPILVDFARRDAITGAAAGVRRVGRAMTGRWTRHRFVSATRGAR